MKSEKRKKKSENRKVILIQQLFQGKKFAIVDGFL